MTDDKLKEMALDELYLEKDIYDVLLALLLSTRAPEKRADSIGFAFERIEYLVEERADIIKKTHIPDGD